MLIDRARIFVRSGRGGDGCVSFRREKYIPKGGPDGGNGGRGGDVVLVGDASLDTLLTVTHRPHYRAENGQQGAGKQMNGADGDHKRVAVPLGTLVFDEEGGELIADIDSAGQQVIVAAGGVGGRGNESYKSATNQAPREATEGAPWVERTLRLELKLIADVGLVGLPNAGKSTLLAAISAARPRVADYPFTTLHPHLGIAELPGGRRLVVADIPGLIEGAAEGAGLGHDFLRHVERTRVLLHLVDIAPVDGSDPKENAATIDRELAAYTADLAGKPRVVALNKIDLVPEDDRGGVTASFDREPLVCSGATGEGIDAVLERCWSLVGGAEPAGWQA